MRVLVTAASKHGSTWEIAKSIAYTLAGQGIDTDVRAIEDLFGLAPYDAVVLGSAVYAGHWLKEARTFAYNEAPNLRIRDLITLIQPQEHRLFAGKLDKGNLRFGEKALALAVRSPQGDFRNWGAIRQWAIHIANTLKQGAGTSSAIR